MKNVQKMYEELWRTAQIITNLRKRIDIAMSKRITKDIGKQLTIDKLVLEGKFELLAKQVDKLTDKGSKRGNTCGTCSHVDGGVCPYAGEVGSEYTCSKWRAIGNDNEFISSLSEQEIMELYGNN